MRRLGKAEDNTPRAEMRREHSDNYHLECVMKV